MSAISGLLKERAITKTKINRLEEIRKSIPEDNQDKILDKLWELNSYLQLVNSEIINYKNNL